MSRPAPPVHGPSPLERPPWLAAGGLAVAATALYAWTSARDLPLVDSGELALAAWSGGVAHPPGFPLYLLVGRVFAHLPGLSPVRGLNLMSALFMGLSVGATFIALERALAFSCTRARGSSRRSSRSASASLGSLVWLTGRVPWSWSGLAEVYALNAFLAAGGWAGMMVGACRMPAWRSPASSRPPEALRRVSAPVSGLGWIAGGFFLAALGLANHHATAAPHLAASAVFLLVVFPELVRRPGCLAGAAAALLSAGSLYGYLMIAARRDRILNWGGIERLGDLARHVAGRQYQLHLGADAVSGRAGLELISSLLIDGGIVFLAVGAALLVMSALPTRGPRGAAAPFGSGAPPRGAGPSPTLGGVAPSLWVPPGILIGLNLVLVLGYSVGPEDRSAYFLPGHWAVAWLLALASSRLNELLPRWRWGATAALTACLVAINLARNFAHCDLREDRAARRLVEETVATMPEGSLFFTSEWNFYAPYLYLRHVEGFRPDLRVIDTLLMRRAWYGPFLELSVPDLVQGAAAEFEAFGKLVRQFDRGGGYDPAAIQAAYENLARRWVAMGQAAGGAFVEFGVLRHPQERPWIESFTTVPRGLAVRLGPAGSIPAAGPRPTVDGEHLRAVRRRFVADDQPLPPPDRVVPQMIRYWKVYRLYEQAVDAWLTFTFLAEGEAAARRLAGDFGRWFPDVELVFERLRGRFGGRPPAAPQS